VDSANSGIHFFFQKLQELSQFHSNYEQLTELGCPSLGSLGGNRSIAWNAMLLQQNVMIYYESVIKMRIMAINSTLHLFNPK
jgi:hypothetical protein